MSWEVRHGDVMAELALMASGSVDCIVTSPPYWGLRDYGVPEAWGLEPTLGEYLDRVRSLGQELMRVLKPSGTFWLNMGDAYAGSGPSGASYQSETTKRREGMGTDGAFRISKTLAQRGLTYAERKPIPPRGFKAKDLIGLPWRVAFALQEQGWYLRSDIIWAKPNPMPESVTDRPTRSHEYVFLLTKSKRYAYDADAIRTEPTSDPTTYKMPDGFATYEGGHGSIHKNGREKGKKPHGSTLGGTYQGRHTLGILSESETRKDAAPSHKGSTFTNGKTGETQGERVGQGERQDNPLGANARTVWTIATQPYPEAHFATFPQELPKRCILAGCPEGGLVLDPFAGSGTTLEVAVRLGRNALGIELNESYIRLIEARMKTVTPSLFGSATQGGTG